MRKARLRPQALMIAALIFVSAGLVSATDAAGDSRLCRNQVMDHGYDPHFSNHLEG